MYLSRIATVSAAQLVFCALAGMASAADPVPNNGQTIKVAAVQLTGYDKGELQRDGFDPTEKIVSYIDRAGADDAELVVFPEYVLGHIDIPGPATTRIAAAAKANSIYVIVGCWEKLEDDQFANTALLFDRTGEIAGRYLKTHAAVDHYSGDVPWAAPPIGKSRTWMKENDPEWIMKRGQDLPVFELDFGRIGIMTCYDGWFPEPARILSLRGAELIVWINGRRGSTEDFIVRSIMFQSHVAMVTTNQAYGGGTMIGEPARRGHIVDRCPDREEAYITGAVNLAIVRRLRKSSRNFSQRRPDLYGDLSRGKPTARTDSGNEQTD